jgi:hypothetical protein
VNYQLSAIEQSRIVIGVGSKKSSVSKIIKYQIISLTNNADQQTQIKKLVLKK